MQNAHNKHKIRSLVDTGIKKNSHLESKVKAIVSNSLSFVMCCRFEECLAPISMATAQLTVLLGHGQHNSAAGVRRNPISPPLVEYCGLFPQSQEKKRNNSWREIRSWCKIWPLFQTKHSLLHFGAGNSHHNAIDAAKQKRGTMQIKSPRSYIRNHASCDMGNYIVHTLQNSQQKARKVPVDSESMVELYLLTVPWQHNS